MFETAIFQSFLLVAISEMGDKTQLLALVLAAKFKKPWAIMAGILVATLANHALAAWAGKWLAGFFSPTVLTYALAATFIGFAFWLLIPDKDDGLSFGHRYGAFLTTTVAFFVAEMGDKTQLATVALGAKFEAVEFAAVAVTLGTTAGMLVSNGLVVFLGDQLTKRLSMKWIHFVAAALFAIFGIGILISGL